LNFIYKGCAIRNAPRRKKYNITTHSAIAGTDGLAEIAEKEPVAAENKSSKGDEEKQGCTALRIAAYNNQQLIVQTDRKAQILIQVNALMISVLLTFALHIPEKHPLLVLPVVAQMITAVVVIVISLAATRPKRGGALYQTAYYSGADSNLLFYGTYAAMEQEAYVREMEYMFEDADQIYDNLIRESFHQARVLGKKYKYLSGAYIVFAVGTGISILLTVVLAFF
jgi:Family of unknown function (DUF5706)